MDPEGHVLIPTGFGLLASKYILSGIETISIPLMKVYELGGPSPPASERVSARNKAVMKALSLLKEISHWTIQRRKTVEEEAFGGFVWLRRGCSGEKEEHTKELLNNEVEHGVVDNLALALAYVIEKLSTLNWRR
nr:hypothetical protein [Tanacetum cinerariifolium]